MRLSVGSIVIDTLALNVTRDGAPVAVEPKVFDLLLLLIANRSRVVSRAELVDKIWAGRIVSDDALSSCIRAVRRTVGDDGKSQQIVRTVHRRGFQWVGPVVEEGPKPGLGVAQARSADREANDPIARLLSTGPPLPPERSIAILPFENLGGDPEREYFSDGLVEDLITALSRKRSLFVIARNSSFSFKGTATDVRRIGRKLGVGYVLEGGVRTAGERLRITAQLIDARTGAHVWADRFDGGIKDVFELQDQIASKVVSLISPAMEQAEIDRSLRKPTESLQAYDYYLRGVSCFRNYTRQHNVQALDLFLRATRIDPDFALAWAHAASCYTQRKAWRWLDGAQGSEAAAKRLATQALRLDRQDPLVLTRAGWALFYVAGEDHAASLVDRAPRLDPNLSEAWTVDGLTKMFLGDASAIQCLEQGLRLNPRDPWIWGLYNGLAQAHFMAGHFEDALVWARKALQELPNYPPSLRACAASLAMMGRVDEARGSLATYLRADPSASLSTLRRFLNFRRDEDFARYAGALRRAGMPE